MTVPAAPVVPAPADPTNPANPVAPVDPKTPATPVAPAEPVTLTPEQWKAAYESDRFKQLNERAKKADELEKVQKDATDAALKEQGKFKELAESKDQELSKMQTAVVNAEAKAEATKLGAANPATVAKLIDRSGVKYNDDGTVTGVTEAIEALRLSDPYLFTDSNNNNPTPPRFGSPANPGNSNTGKYEFTMSQMKDPVFYKENRAALLKAASQGRVDPSK